MTAETAVLSRHRLPRPYRIGLAVAWSLPAGLLMGALLAGQGVNAALLDARLLVPLGVMLLPAVYIWQEGVDVLADGLVIRVHWPRRRDYAELARWSLDAEALTVWDRAQDKALEVHAAHLTDLAGLVRALDEHLEEVHGGSFVVERKSPQP
ncbi:MAG: hypothetical protein JNM70_18750 [Anaerolineae bacterium]|nr:hypothetical protein [Anaerolineae bacterium]